MALRPFVAICIDHTLLRFFIQYPLSLSLSVLCSFWRLHFFCCALSHFFRCHTQIYMHTVSTLLCDSVSEILYSLFSDFAVGRELKENSTSLYATRGHTHTISLSLSLSVFRWINLYGGPRLHILEDESSSHEEKSPDIDNNFKYSTVSGYWYPAKGRRSHVIYLS